MGKNIEKKKKQRNLVLFFIALGVLLVINMLIFLPKKNITCFKIETIVETYPYEDIEYYYEREPYTICAGYSFWTGKCNEWKTEYEQVRKSRTITRYDYEEIEVEKPYYKLVNWIYGNCE